MTVSEWEWSGLALSDVVMFWVPRNMQTLPGLTTNVEFGMLVESGKVVLGTPNDGEHNGYLQRLATRFLIPQAHTLSETVEKTIWRAQM